MAPLPTNLRKLFEKAIVKARQSAEYGAKNALEMLAIDRHEPHTSMPPEERKLRNRLRARGRQLGDVRDKARGTQSISRLIQEVAYEYWHRMLFARFLTENHLLIEPSSGIAISMEECEELAREAGEDPRSMAARFAQDSLPQIFRSGDPVLEVTLAPESRQALDNLLESLPAAVFTADDSLGWTYQYWQAEKKDAVNASGNKIGADELPAVTQLFTEHYMVLFLFHNTIGAWHAGKVLAENPSLTKTAQSEDELRQAVRLRSQGGYDFKYLRFVREMKEGDEEDSPTGVWRPAAGIFEDWPKAAKELKVLDPCCGSGHFLIEGFDLLVRLRMDEEGLDLEDATHSVLVDNLHGLELDPRCTQIAAFNLALAAWKLTSKPLKLPAVQIACSGLAVGSTEAEWGKLAGENERLLAGIKSLYALFEQAPILGSLIDPNALIGDIFEADFSELRPLLKKALEQESADAEDTERAVTAQGMALAAELLSGEYTLVITNVPYLKRNSMSNELRSYCDANYPNSKAALETVFLERMIKLLEPSGASAAVSQQYWLSLGSYKRLRKRILRHFRWPLLARLGAGAFHTIGGEVVNVCLQIIAKTTIASSNNLSIIDVSRLASANEKEKGLHEQNTISVSQDLQLNNPDSRIISSTDQNLSQSPRLSTEASSNTGLQTGDNDRFSFVFWELPETTDDWEWFQRTVDSSRPFGGCTQILRWENGEGAMVQLPGSTIRGLGCVGKAGVLVHRMGSLPATIYTGNMFDQNGAVILPRVPENCSALWCYLASAEYAHEIRKLDSKLGVTPATLVKCPFDLDRWQKIADENYPNDLPEPQSDDPTQWLFHGHPAHADLPTVLQVAVSRLLGYRWPPELDPEMRLADEAREWVARCDELKEFADEDGIVCLSATRGERSATERLRELLSAAFGPSWSAAKEREFLTVAGDGKKPAASLEVWLRDKFFEEHCKLFHHRPFVWHIWDGNKEGFHCLVNAHKLTGPNGEGRRTLEAITYSYLGDWIDRQNADQAEGKEGSDARLAAAQDLQGQLVKTLEGEPPYDPFVRWKPIHEQAIGWDPDINDGVRLNARPFMNAELRKGGKKGAGVLRWKPNIKWGPKADRGKEPQSMRPKADFPWFWGRDDEAVDFAGGIDFDGNRWNNLHYSIAFKQAARERYNKRKK